MLSSLQPNGRIANRVQTYSFVFVWTLFPRSYHGDGVVDATVDGISKETSTESATLTLEHTDSTCDGCFCDRRIVTTIALIAHGYKSRYRNYHDSGRYCGQHYSFV